VDPKLEEIYRLTLDTNKMVHKMHRSHMWGRFFTFTWWLAIAAISAAAYYYYLQPYLDQIIHLYQQILAGGAQAQSASQQLSSFFGNFINHASSTPR
jgi:hypothetical protein